jgi:hypothetical protein
MRVVSANIKSIMLVSGILTCTMFYAAVAPREALLSTFGETLEGPVAEIVVRNWGVLITLIGAMLIYGAFHPPVRMVVLTAAILSKLAFVALVLTLDRAALAHQAGIAVAVDSVWIALFLVFLFGRHRPA